MLIPTPQPGDIFFAGYIDPSAGHIFSSAGPLLLSFLGGALGFVAIFLRKIKKFIVAIFKQKAKDDTQEKSGSNRD